MYLSKDYKNPKNVLGSTVITPMNSTIGPYIGTPMGTPMGIPRTSNYNSFQSMKTMNDVLFNDILKTKNWISLNTIGGAFLTD